MQILSGQFGQQEFRATMTAGFDSKTVAEKRTKTSLIVLHGMRCLTRRGDALLY